MQSVRDSQDQEDAKFLERLEHLAGRKREMERRYKRIFKLHPNRLNSFLQAERDQAAGKIQNWWRGRDKEIKLKNGRVGKDIKSR